MLRNYLNLGLRNLLRNKLFSLINILGMAISMASFLIIALFIYDEMKFDKHVDDYQLKFRIFGEYPIEDGSIRNGATIAPPIPPMLAAAYPEVESYARLLSFDTPQLFKAGEKKFTEPGGARADGAIFRMLSLKLVEGDIGTALRELNTIAISQSLAKKYFGNKPALGEAIEVSNDNFIVDAVFEDFSPHSHLQIHYFLTLENRITYMPQRMADWGWTQFHSYIKLIPGTDTNQFEKKLDDFAEKHIRAQGESYRLRLMPLAKIHLHASDQMWDIAVRGSAQTIYILLATAVFIIVIAILNFVNLSTARAVSRAREVGIRKVVGAFRTQLIFQFISESVIIAFTALLIGGLLAEAVLPLLNSFTEKSIPSGVFLNPAVILALTGFGILIGVAAGAYPAFYISRYRPASILGNQNAGFSGRAPMRKGLVVLQFILSFFLIIAAFTVSQQHSYMRNTDMGFDKDNLVVVVPREEMRDNLEATKQIFSDHPDIVSAALGYGLPGEAFPEGTIVDKKSQNELRVSLLSVDHDYPKTLGLEFVAGRDFFKDSRSDEEHGFIISETTARMLGYVNPADAVGHQLSWDRWDKRQSVKEGEVIGVVRDIQLNTMRETLSAVVLHIFPIGYISLTLRIREENVPATIAHLEKCWRKLNSNWPFEYKFLDENFDKMYKSEEKLATLFIYFTGFTIFVACLGLFGLVVYSTTQRYREISIRKVLGADEIRLVMQLSKTFLRLILIAFVIAVPVSYYAANSWLSRFAYRMEITPVLFIKAGALIMAVALITVGIQSFKAARANPVDALKEQ